MSTVSYPEKLRMFYGTSYDFLRKNPEFDGRPHPDHPGMLRPGVDPSSIRPWPGVADAKLLTREAWIEARLDAVRRGDEEPALRSPINGGGPR